MNEKLKVYDTKMQKTMDSLDSEMGTIRAGRANPHILDKLTVDYYGSPYTDSAGGKYHGSGSSYDPDPAMGIQPDQGN